MNIPELRDSIRGKGEIHFSRSGGPGGQNVNKVNTRVMLRLRVGDLAGLNEAETARLRETLAGRLTAGDEIIISSGEERSQGINRERAYSRLEAIITAAARLPKHRRPTKPSRTVREKRLQSKRLHSQKKAARRPSPEE
ncbi:MAG: aminoacyl-tRNA hydrolase [Treponema sp.]|jgi:ribosome-associated protein|nr:aminoacyl-tRNA hydrolase [Treponema sp.]